MVAAIPLQSYTAEEFLELDLPEEQKYELINGIIVPMAEPSGKHENLRSELWFSLKSQSKRANLELLIHPQPVLILGKKDTRKPDLIAIDFLLQVGKRGRVKGKRNRQIPFPTGQKYLLQEV